MVGLKELRENTIKLFKENNIGEARADTDFLLSFFLGADKSRIILGTKKVTAEEEAAFNKAVMRRLGGEPVQYITGEAEFMSLKLFVDSSTLIPRADTEILAEKCLEYIDKYSLKTVLDIGTGSGAIGISLCRYNKAVSAVLLDISKKALLVAEKNTELHGLSDRINLLNMDILKEGEALPMTDLIVSNPPYIETGELSTLEEKVRAFEPAAALDGGADGLVFYRRITSLAAAKARYLAFEIGYNQAESVRAVMEEYFSDIELVYDYGKNPRVLIGKNKQI